MKGGADLPILAIFVGMSMILLLFSSFYLAQNPTQATLYAETDFSQQKYQVMEVGSVLLREPDIRQNIGLYQYVDSEDRDSLKNSITQSSETVLLQQSRNYYFNVSGIDMDVGQGNPDRIPKTGFYVTSPSKEQVEVIIGVGEQRR